jgi:hypothetical protein
MYINNINARRTHISVAVARRANILVALVAVARRTHILAAVARRANILVAVARRANIWVAVGFNPRSKMFRPITEPRSGDILTTRLRRYAALDDGGLFFPWVKTHGYPYICPTGNSYQDVCPTGIGYQNMCPSGTRSYALLYKNNVRNMNK